MDLPTQALALGYLSLSWGFGTILGEQLFCAVLLCFLLCVCTGFLKEKKRNDYAFWRQFNEKPSIIPGCPGTGVLQACLTSQSGSHSASLWCAHTHVLVV